MSSSILSRNVTVTKCPPIIRKNLFKSNSSLPVVDDKYMSTMICNSLVSLITSIERLEPPSYWYILLVNSKGSVSELLKLEDCVCFYLY